MFPNIDSPQQCGLVEFPGLLPNLRILNLSWNIFVEIPSEVSRLRQLEQLFLARCTRLRLPSSISMLTALSWLRLDECNQLPDKFNALFDGEGVQDALVMMSRHFARFECCRAACVTLIGLRRSRRDTILLSQPLDITVLVAKLVWQAR